MPQTGVQNIFLGFNQKAPLANKNLPSACGTRNLARKSAVNGGAEYFSWLQSKSSLGKQKFAERLRHAEFGPQVTGSVFWIWSAANRGAEYFSWLQSKSSLGKQKIAERLLDLEGMTRHKPGPGPPQTFLAAIKKLPWQTKICRASFGSGGHDKTQTRSRSTANGGAEYDSINPLLTTRAAITPRAYHSPTNSGRQTESIFGFLDLKNRRLTMDARLRRLSLPNIAPYCAGTRDGHGSGSGYKSVDPDPNPKTYSIHGFTVVRTEVREGLLRFGLLRSALTDFLGRPPTAVTSYEGL
ncbi:hypothetical protein B0H10DRAFT_1951760 [Mycena sp. CBHHK59/15]|nr:hypothetical protein B0H10DRAFT_1951760 [Mycena sp. CBHHK59/15]